MGEHGDGIVQVAYLHPEHVSHSWHDSMRRLREYDDTVGGQRVAPRPLNIRCGSGALIVQMRNYATQLFLDKTDHEWLLFVDTDMGFEADAVHRLLAVADPDEAPVVGALCFAHYDPRHDGMGGHRLTIVPTMYKIGNVVETGHARICYYGPYPQDTVTQVAATGAAFLLIHRSALETVRKEHGDKWFSQIMDEDGDIVGEDFSFCIRLGAAGIPIFVHTGVKTTHHKEIWLSEADYIAQSMLAEDEAPDLPVGVHVDASLASLANNQHVRADGMLKLDEDLARYEAIIRATAPEVIVETGTRTGASARWFFDLECIEEVITIDVANEADTADVVAGKGRVTFLRGDAADPEVAKAVANIVAGRRCMVSLDSDHSAAHVAKEIDLYGPLVSPGCYLVVEDGIFGYAPPALVAQHFPAGLVGSPLDAIAEKLVDNPDWSRDIAIERTAPVSHHPAGFWVRR